jgi:uncharacterized protein (PEP-CTERM system associated)
MDCARIDRRSRATENAVGQRHLSRKFWLLLATIVMPATQAGAQTSVSTPGAPSASTPSLVPGSLPILPQGAFGLPNPAVSPDAIYNGPPLPSAEFPPVSTLGLPPIFAGVTPLQAYDPTAPAVLIQPYVSGGLSFTDNANYVHSNRTAAAGVIANSGVSISADTPRLQAVFSGQVQGTRYVPANNLDQIYGSMYANGVGTIIPDLFFVDARSAVSVASLFPGFGFVSPNSLGRNQQTQVFTNTISPYLRGSYDGVLDGELRYRFGSTNYAGNTQVVATPTTLANNNLANGTFNEGTLTLASGRDFERALSRLTIDASEFNSVSTNRNTQFSAFDDLEYRITPQIAALGRIGYQNIQYPFAPAATFAGPTWLVGGRVGLAEDYGYASLQYGVQQGVYGFTGSAVYRITPTMTATATLSQGISSPTQYFQTALATSSLNPFGAIVDQYSGLPTAFYNPGLGLTNNVYRQHLANFGVTESIGVNRLSLYGYYTTQQSLTPPITSPTKSFGASLTWSRDIRPDLTGTASVTYSTSSNVVTINNPGPINNLNTTTGNLGLSYLISERLSGSIVYSFSYQNNGSTVNPGRTGDIIANTLSLFVTKTF